MTVPMSSSNERPLLSSATILILSGFLVGMAIGESVDEGLEPYVLSCGISGFLAYIALSQSAHRREMQAWLDEQKAMEHRLDRHVMSLSSVEFSLPPASECAPDQGRSTPGAKGFGFPHPGERGLMSRPFRAPASTVSPLLAADMFAADK